MDDALVIGSGPNGLVAANLLADAGWSVLVLEAQPTVGGAANSDTELADGFVQDTFSAFYPLGAASPVLRGLGLESYGLTWCHAPAVLGNPIPGGDWALLQRDAEATAADLDAASPGDGTAWLELWQLWERLGDQLLGAILTPFPPVKHGAALAGRMVRHRDFELLRTLVLSARRMAEERFSGTGARLLVAGNAMHADIAPEGAGSGMFGWLLAMLGHSVGFPVPQGGAGRLSAALARRLTERGGRIRCDAEVTEVTVHDRRATGVVLAGGERLEAGRAVLADVVATRLYGGLVGWEHLPARLRRAMRSFQWDPGTVKVDFALSGPAPWDPAPRLPPGCIHIADDLTDLSTFAAQLASGLVPSNPLLLVGQMTTTDPSRSPAGTESLWTYTHVPQHVLGDAGPDGLTGDWAAGDSERMADRIQARIERYAPGFGSRVVARRVLGPPDLQARNANLVGGAINGGTANLHQQLVFRPALGLGRAETPVRGLYLSGASAHPGGAVHGGPGANAARAALFHDRLRRAASRL